MSVQREKKTRQTEAAGICLKHMVEEPEFEPWNPCQKRQHGGSHSQSWGGRDQKVPGAHLSANRLLGEFQAKETLRFFFFF